MRDEKITEASPVDTLVDIGLEWAKYGLKTSQTALELAAKTLQDSVKALEQVSSGLRRKE